MNALPQKGSVSASAIVSALTEWGVAHSLSGEAALLNSSLRLRPASLHEPIAGGLYFVIGDQARLSEVQSPSVVLVKEAPHTLDGNLYIIVSNPETVYCHLATLWSVQAERGVHPTAVVEDSTIDPSVSIGPYAVIRGATIGAESVIRSHCVIEGDVKIGDRVEIGPASSLGVKAASWVWESPGRRLSMPQIGGVRIGDNSWIGTHVSVSGGLASERTIIERGAWISHNTCIGHGACIGANAHLAHNVAIAGNARLGQGGFVGSGAVVSSTCKVGDLAIIGAGAVVATDFPDELLTLAGVPAKIIRRRLPGEGGRGVPRSV